MVKKRFKLKKVSAMALMFGVALITLGATYSFFSYLGTGTKENIIESGSIKFHYSEDSQGISITDGMPMDDNTGKGQNKYFDFSITSATSRTIKIPYYVTVRRKGNDNSLDNYVKLYLTEVNNNTETPLILDNGKQISKYGELDSYINDTLNITVAKNEKSLFRGIVPVNTNNFEKHYRLRMWLTDGVEYTQSVTGVCSDTTYTTRAECVAAHENWTDTATTDSKEFTIKVNVYGFANEASSNANVNSVSVNNTVLTPVSTDTYETELQAMTNNATISVETEHEDATVQVIKTQSDYSTPVAVNNKIQKMSITKSLQAALSGRDNYFKVLVTSENGTNTKELHVKIVAPFVLSSQIRSDNTLKTGSLDFTNTEPRIVSYNDEGFRDKVSNFDTYNTSNSSTNYRNMYYVYSDSYTFDTTTGTYTLVNPQVCQYSSCYETLKNKYIVDAYGSDSNSIGIYSGLYTIYKVTSDTTLAKIYYNVSIEATKNRDSSYSGLYSMNVTNGYGGQDGTTYYFRGAIENNYVTFAGKDWRIVRINEDGTVRLILDDSTDGNGHAFNTDYDDFLDEYYSNSTIKSDLESWYNTNITGNNATKVATGNYFCEAARVKAYDHFTTGDATVVLPEDYTPDLTCQADGNGYGIVPNNPSVALLTYDEVVLAGATPPVYRNGSDVRYIIYNELFYLSTSYNWWLITPDGLYYQTYYNKYEARKWIMRNKGGLVGNSPIYDKIARIRPVINLKADVVATGTGTSTDPYIVQ